MKRARGKNSAKSNTRSKYDSIDVPQNVKRGSAEREYINATIINKARPTKPVVRKKKKKIKNKTRRFLFFTFLAIVILFLAVMGMGWGNNGDEGALIPVDMEAGKVNVLLLGVDNDGLRTDAMMLVSYNFSENTANIMSIPRDTQIKVTDRGVTRKINEIHAMHDKDNNLIGPMGSIKAVTALTSVPIHYYIEFSFKAIDELADALGPIEFDVPDVEGKGRGMNYEDPVQDLYIHLKPGVQKLSGNQVQQFLRYRKSSITTVDGSDLSRVKRQQEFIKAAIDQKVNIGLIAKLPSIYSKLKKNIKTNFSVGDIVKYSKYLKGITGEALSSNSLPGESKRTGSGWYFICDLNKTAELITQDFGYDAAEITNKISLDDVQGTKDILKADKNKGSTKKENTSKETDKSEKKTDNKKKDDEKASDAEKKSDNEDDKEISTPEPETTDESEKIKEDEDASESNDYDYDNSDPIVEDHSEDKDVIISSPETDTKKSETAEIKQQPSNSAKADDDVVKLD